MENVRRLDVRVVLGMLAAVLAAGAIWAATAFAAGGSGSSTNEPASGNVPAAEYVQEEGETPQQREDCPERDGEGEGDSGSSDATSFDL